ncbi:hypothetical protein A1O1_01529 [Capronia coronata CBS 617.96]|uniref:N-acetyltransferase B complex non catalytic subunit n=1 Tax=Capronia coronata CBS 617.96 TaxID=1182541 RepID=W9YV83_9EURO|nr:uncharacterized protein A1O1_01529 [Capronia coronata CBS 617.96]EXJ96403.1 hypothetical protein A1O1_01529 [Capronia coronata CBS 617.96]
MSDAVVSERRIRPIQDAVATANWKQALQLCDKWAKKGEKSDRFLALKAFVLVNQPDKAQHDRGHAEVLELCKRSPPFTQPEAIYQLQDALKSLSLQQEGPKLWERAVTAKQNDEDLYMRWLNQAIRDNNWLSAQKATMGLRKSFPKKPHYEFWNIMMCQLIHMQDDLPEKDRTLFGTLAYRMISKAAESIPSDQEEPASPGKAISSPEEIALLVQILNSTGRSAETVKLLQSNSLGMESRVGKKDPQIVLSLLLESLELSEQWDEAHSLCQNFLLQSDLRSDDRIWRLWLKAQSRSSVDGLDPKSQELLDSVCSIRPPVRAAFMAKMQWLRSRNGEVEMDALLQTCKDYSQAFSEKAFCFDDLKESLRHLDKARFEDFTSSCSEQGNLSRLFKLKLSYSSLQADVSQKHLLAFISQALQLFKASLSDAPGCPEAAILAVMAMLRLSTRGETRTISVAAILLQIARSKFEDFYLFSVFLVRIQAHLGLLSLAMETFTRLSVKNLQWETVGHLILTRISTLHPMSSGPGEDTFDPLRAIDTGLTILENADNALVRGIREGLRFNSYSNIYNSVTMRSDIARSVNRQIYAIEERKLRRSLGLPEDTVLAPSPSSLVDKRDFAYLPAYRPDDSELLGNISCGPLPKEKWILAMALCDNVATYIKAELASLPLLAVKAFDALKQSQVNLERLQEDAATEMTKAEMSSFECYQILARAAVFAKESTSSKDTILGLLEKLQSWMTARLAEHKDGPFVMTLADIRTPTWEGIHTSLVELETLQVIAMFLASLARRPKSKSKALAVPPETLTGLQNQILELERAVHAAARELKGQINAPGVLGKLVDLGMARDEAGKLAELASLLETLCDEVTMETICGHMKESWEDALDGVLAVKVKLYK